MSHIFLSETKKVLLPTKLLPNSTNHNSISTTLFSVFITPILQQQAPSKERCNVFPVMADHAMLFKYISVSFFYVGDDILLLWCLPFLECHAFVQCHIVRKALMPVPCFNVVPCVMLVSCIASTITHYNGTNITTCISANNKQ